AKRNLRHRMQPRQWNLGADTLAELRHGNLRGALPQERVEPHLAAVAISAALAVMPRDEDQILPVIDAKFLRVAAIAAQKQNPDGLNGSTGGQDIGADRRERQLLSY